MIKRLTLIAIAAVLTFSTSFAAAAEQDKSGLRKVWQIGKINGGYYEFSAKGAREWMRDFPTTFATGFDVSAGKKNIKDAFPGIQPGPSAGWGDNKTYPLRIHFTTDSIAPGGYVLTAGISGVSSMEDAILKLNGNNKTQSNLLPRGDKEEILNSSVGVYGNARIVYFYVAPETLAPGKNTLTLTVTSGQWIIYDYLTLEEVSDISKPAVMNFATAFPPFLLREGKDVARPIDISCFNAGPARDATLSIKTAKIETKKNIKLNPGKCDFRTTMKDFQSPDTAEITLAAGGAALARASVPVTPVRRVTIYLMPHSHYDIGYPDIQPNIVIDQRTFIENALDVIEQKHKHPMTWVVETSWNIWMLLNGKGPWEEYGESIMNSRLMTTVPESFWKDSMKLKNIAFSSTVTSSASSDPNSLNNRRIVDAAPTGWISSGPAKGAWVELAFKQPKPIEFIAIRRGRDESAEMKSLNVTFTGDGGKTETNTTGPLPVDRERLLVPSPMKLISKIRIEITNADKPDMRANLMEIETYISAPIAETQNRALKAIRDGRMDVSGLYLNFLTQLIPTEWLIRSMMPTHKISKLTGTKFKTALITDVPGFTFALPDIFSGSGIRYFYTGINDYHAPTSLNAMPRAFWWQGPGGGKIMVFRSFENYNEGYFWGFTRSADLIETNAPALMKMLDAENYPYDTLPLRTLGDVIDDGPIPEIIPEIVEEWNRRWAWPRVEIGTPTKFFTEFEKKHGASLPTKKGDWTAYWEDGAASSATETLAIRRIHHSLLTATAFGAIQNRITGPSAALNKLLTRIEEDIYLYDEHTWGAAGSVREPASPQTTEQWFFKQLPVIEADKADLFKGIAPLLGSIAPQPKHGGQILAALNGADRIKINPMLSGNLLTNDAPVEFIDIATGAKVKSAFVRRGKETGYILSDTLPAMGVKFYEVVAGSKKEFAQQPGDTSANILENSFYRIEADTDTGRLNSIFDKQLGKELIDGSAGYSMNEFIYVPGTVNSKQLRMEKLNISAGESNIYYSEMIISGKATMFPTITQTVRIFNNIKRIEFENKLNKTETLDKEGVYFAFPMKVPGGEIRTEVTGGVMAIEKDQLPGACRDWISMQDGLAAVGNDYSILIATPDAPLIVPEKIDVLSYRKKLDLNNTTVFSYIMNNYWDTNYRASQGGEITFRYALTSLAGRAKDSDIINFGRETAILAMPVLVSRPAGGTNAKDSVSFLSVESENIRILGVKTSEDGKGIIVRMQEMDGKSVNVKLRINPLLKITSAMRTNLVEELEKKLNILRGKGEVIVTDKIGAYGMLTIMLK